MALGTSRVLVLLGVQQDVGILYVVSGSDGKESACNAGERGSIPGLGRSPGEEREWLPPPAFLLENPMNREDWSATVHGVSKSQTQLSN